MLTLFNDSSVKPYAPLVQTFLFHLFWRSKFGSFPALWVDKSIHIDAFIISLIMKTDPRMVQCEVTARHSTDRIDQAMRSRSSGADSVRTLNEENKENMEMERVIQLRSALLLMSSTEDYSSSRTPSTFAHHDWDRTHLANVNVTNKAYHMFLLVSMATL